MEWFIRSLAAISETPAAVAMVLKVCRRSLPHLESSLRSSFVSARCPDSLSAGNTHSLACNGYISLPNRMARATQNHLARQGDIKCALAAALRLCDVQCAPSEVDVIRLDLPQSRRPRTRQQHEEMKFTTHRVLQQRQFGEPSFQ